MQKKFVAALLMSIISTMLYAQEASAQGANPNAPLLTEADIKPCEALLAKGLAADIRRARTAIQDYGPGGKQRSNHADSVSDARLADARKSLEKLSGLSILEFALQNPPYSPGYDDLKDINYWIKNEKEIIAILQSGSEERMYRVIGKSYAGQELEDRLTGDTKFLCMLNVRLAQLTSKPGSKPAAAKTTQPLPKAASETGNSSPRIEPGAPVAGLSQQQVASCSEEIRRTQLELQSWPGTSIEVAARLGRFQKDLFEGRCAGHPEAQAYLAGANKMLGYSGNPAGSGAQRGADVNKTAGLSPQQIASCSEEIRRTQLESQSWSGTSIEVAARLGRFQKDLFEGRCAGHPEAQAYLAGANKMIGYGGNPAIGGAPVNAGGAPINAGGNKGTSAGNLAPPRSGTKPTAHNPAHDATKCIKIYHENEMKARGLKTILRSIMVNNCSYPISVVWCVEAGKGGPGDCNPGYSNTVDMSARGTRGVDSNYQPVRYAACRFGKDMGIQPLENDPRQPFRFSCS